MDPFCWRPVLAGIWRHREIFDGTYSFEDLLDAHELLDVKAANEYRVQSYLESGHGY